VRLAVYFFVADQRLRAPFGAGGPSLRQEARPGQQRRCRAGFHGDDSLSVGNSDLGAFKLGGHTLDIELVVLLPLTVRRGDD